jgi:hypothetical protein
MAAPTFHINISGSVVALYAAIVATITGAVQIMNFFRDRRKVNISVQRNMEMIGDPAATGITFTVVTVANAGRRPVTIANVGGYKLYPGKGFIASTCNPPVPRELTEGKHLMALFDQSELEFSDIESWETYDAVGHVYRLPVAPLHKRLISRMRRKWSWRQAAKTEKLKAGK